MMIMEKHCCRLGSPAFEIAVFKLGPSIACSNIYLLLRQGVECSHTTSSREKPRGRGSIRWGPELSPRGAIAAATLMELGQSGPRTQSEKVQTAKTTAVSFRRPRHPTFYTRRRSGIKGLGEMPGFDLPTNTRGRKREGMRRAGGVGGRVGGNINGFLTYFLEGSTSKSWVFQETCGI